MGETPYEERRFLIDEIEIIDNVFQFEYNHEEFWELVFAYWNPFHEQWMLCESFEALR